MFSLLSSDGDPRSFADCQGRAEAFGGLPAPPVIRSTVARDECYALGQSIEDGTRVYVDKTKQRIKFENETESHVTIVIEGKE